MILIEKNTLLAEFRSIVEGQNLIQAANATLAGNHSFVKKTG